MPSSLFQNYLKILKIAKISLFLLKFSFTSQKMLLGLFIFFAFKDNEILIRIVNLVSVRINFDVYWEIYLN